MKAHEYFEICREKVRAFSRTEQRYAELCGFSVPPIRYDGAHGGSSDPMARIDAALDFSQIVNERRAELNEILEYATSVLYGIDGHGGLAKLKGFIYADAICMHYLQDMPWKDIAEQSEIYSSKQVRNYAMSGMSCIDRYGFAYMRGVHDGD